METNENRALARGWIWIPAFAVVVGVVILAAVFDDGDGHTAAVAVTVAAPPPAPTPANSAPPATKAATPAPTQESTVTVSPPSWSPPEWLLGYWSTADGVWQVAAEPGWVDVVIYGDEAMVTYTIEDWSDDRGDVFSLTVTLLLTVGEDQSGMRLTRDG